MAGKKKLRKQLERNPQSKPRRYADFQLRESIPGIWEAKLGSIEELVSYTRLLREHSWRSNKEWVGINRYPDDEQQDS